MIVIASTIPFRVRTHRGPALSFTAVCAPQPLHYLSQERLPTSKPVETLRLRCARVTEFALERHHVLAAVIRWFDDGDWRARRHHPVTVATVECKGPSSCEVTPALYDSLLIAALTRSSGHSLFGLLRPVGPGRRHRRRCVSPWAQGHSAGSLVLDRLGNRRPISAAPPRSGHEQLGHPLRPLPKTQSTYDAAIMSIARDPPRRGFSGWGLSYG